MAINDDERLRVLLKSNLLDSSPEEAFDRLTQLAVALLDVPISLVSIIDRDRQYFKSYAGLPEPWASRRQTPLSHSLCQYVVTSRKPLIVKDARQVVGLKENMAIPELGMVAYLGFPLLVEDQALGSFCAADTKPHAWSPREIKMVQKLASCVDAELVARMETRKRQKKLLLDLADVVDAELISRMETRDHQKAPERWQKHENQLHLFLNQVPIIIWQTDTSGAITFLNATWVAFTGLSEQASRGNGWLAAIHPEDRTEISAFQQRPGGFPWLSSAEVRVQRADGVYREMLGHGCPYTDHQGKLLGYIGTLLNMTERKEGEHQWETFLGIVAHELKSPLTAIKGNIQLAQRRLARVKANVAEQSTEQLQESLTQVMDLLIRNQENLQIQTRQIYELQDLSRVQGSQLDVRLAPCDLVECVRQVVQDQQVAYPQRLVLFDAPGDPPIRVWGDEQRLRQVVMNYVANACKYSFSDQPVQVGITRAATSVRVWVRDHGVGLSAEEQEQIWKPFSQVPGTMAQTGLSGLGLGLHICKALIQQQHGEVGVESAPGEGSTFWFTLPLVQE